eukprot:6140711-Karenia_brevis.AAC.1
MWDRYMNPVFQNRYYTWSVRSYASSRLESQGGLDMISIVAEDGCAALQLSCAQPEGPGPAACSEHRIIDGN